MRLLRDNSWLSLVTPIVLFAAMIASTYALKRIPNRIMRATNVDTVVASVTTARPVISQPTVRIHTRMYGQVSRMSVQQFGQVLKSDLRSNYQILDVREQDELDNASIKGEDIIHLPMSKAAEWSTKVLDGELLDPTKPTLCLCHAGIRSMRVASFLGK